MFRVFLETHQNQNLLTTSCCYWYIEFLEWTNFLGSLSEGLWDIFLVLLAKMHLKIDLSSDIYDANLDAMKICLKKLIWCYAFFDNIFHLETNVSQFSGISVTLCWYYGFFLQFTVQAIDNRSPMRMAEAIVIVKVNRNNFLPEFQGQPYRTILSENSNIGFSIFTVRARDRDIQVTVLFIWMSYVIHRWFINWLRSL